MVLLTGEEGELSYRRWCYSLGKRGGGERELLSKLSTEELASTLIRK